MQDTAGLGLRPEHYSDLLAGGSRQVGWFEILTENHFDTLGRPWEILPVFRETHECSMHGVGLSIASPDGPDDSYLTLIKRLVSHVEPFLVTDHLCFSRYEDKRLHDLLPFPFNPESLDIIARNCDAVKDHVRTEFALENISAYIRPVGSTMTELEFLSRLYEKTGTRILLDVNNLYVNSVNFGDDPLSELAHIPEGAVAQMHLAGYTDTGSFLFDTHSAPVADPVWELFRQATLRLPATPFCIEPDADMPSLQEMLAELSFARQIVTRSGAVA